MTLREPTWWIWLVTGSLLLAGVLGSREAFGATILFALAQYAYFAAADDSRLSSPAQVRLGFAVYLAGVDAAGLPWLCWIAVAGTLVRLLFGYCLLARTLSLLPWNRSEPLSLDFLRRTFLTPPSPFVSEGQVAAVAAESGRVRDEALETETRIDRGVREATQRRASIANFWRKQNSPRSSGLTDREEWDCAS